jgi:hypothetical protein
MPDLESTVRRCQLASAAEILGGQLVSIRIEPATLMFFAPGTRALLRTRPNPLTPPRPPRPHSWIALTMEIYTQVPDDVTRDALRRLSDWLDHDGGSPS